MNGMRGARRCARPVRLALASPLRGDIDGAWWPHTASVAGELPDLIEALHRPLGEIIDISINWSATDGAPDLDSMSNGAKLMPGWRNRRQRLMVIAGRRACAKLLVVPHMTSPDLGLMVLRRAARLPVPGSQHDTQVFRTAESVLCAAQTESASWATRTHNTDAAETRTESRTESRTLHGLHNEQPSPDA